MPWLLLTVAGLLEVVWAIAMKRSEGFKTPVATSVTVIAMVASFYLLWRVMRILPIGTAYPIWVGIGAVGTAIAGAILFKDRFTLAHAGFVALIVIGIVGLKVMTPSKSPPIENAPDRAQPAPEPDR